MKTLPSIQNNFSCLILIITGKSRGGSRRTNSLTAGYGALPLHSIFTEAINTLSGYRHTFGAFGIKMFMNRSFKNAYR